MKNPISIVAAAALACVLLLPSMAFSQSRAAEFPSRPVRLVLPFPPGGTTDATARMFASSLQGVWKQSVIIENKPGGFLIIGAAEVARIVVDLCNEKSSPTFVYEDSDPLWEKMKKVATKVYGAADITADTKVSNRIKELQEGGYGHYPVCVAKTQSSFSTDPNLRGAPSGHLVNVREVRLAAGAEFVVMVCGDIMTMPGLPKVPSAEKIDLTDDGKVVGLF